MPKINILPKCVSQLIAAGEVVERPSSVVKELVENSVDANAHSITTEIKNGGIKYIRVTDDGSGISREDAPDAFMSHATSKIKTEADLNSILTLGFRGEALGSIAAVSRLLMLTRTAAEETGTSFEIEGGEKKSIDFAGCPEGTTIIVRDLFYNTPARMKFLKRDITEGAYVADVVTKAAISHPEIRFLFIKDGRQVFSTSGNGDLLSAVYAALGKQVSEGLIKCEYEHKSIKVSGLISKPLSNRPNRNLQYCYVNGRFVRVPAAAAALDEAYKNRIMAGKFPMCFLFIDIPPEKTDVNVHPAKMEIRFSEDTPIFETIYYAAKSALNKGDIERPSVVLAAKHDKIFEKKPPEAQQLAFGKSSLRDKMSVEAPKVEDGDNCPAGSQNKIAGDSDTGVFRDGSSALDNLLSKDELNGIKEIAPKSSLFRHVSGSDRKNGNIDIFVDDGASDANAEEKAFSPPASGELNNAGTKTSESEIANFTVVGEVFRTYIIVEQDNRLLIIDKHAAHERMIFNRLSQRGLHSVSQLLLSPLTVALSGREYACVIENLEVFSSGGFLVEDFGKNTVIVRECPVTLENEDISSIIVETAGELLRGNIRPMPEKLQWLYSSTACRAALKAGDSMKKEETEAFVTELLGDDSIRYCPHGRPVMYELTKREIEKQFGRI